VPPPRLDGWLPLLAEVLGVAAPRLAARVAEGSFVALGGTSLRAIELSALGERHLARRPDVSRLLGDEPVATVLAAAPACAPYGGATAPTGDGGPRPLLPAQRPMLAAHLAGRDRPYHLLFTLDAPVHLDPDRVRGALGALVRRHESLRTMFVSDDGGPGRLVLAPAHRPRLLLAEHDGDDPVAAVHDRYAASSAALLRPFERPPVLFVLTRTPTGSLLTMLVHHVLVDGWSVGLLWREFARLHDEGPDALGPAAPPADRIGDRLAEVTASGELRDALERAGRRLGDAPGTLVLPTDLPRPADPDHAGARLAFALTASRAAATVAGRCGVTLPTVLAAAWSLVVARRTGATDLLLAMPFAGRTTAELAAVVGLCSRVAPVRCRIDDDAPVDDWIRSVGAAVRAAGGDAEIPFDQLVEATGVPADPTRNPLAQVGFAAHHELVPAGVTVGGAPARIREGHGRGSLFDAMLYLQQWRPQARLALEYRTAVLTPAEAAALADSFQAAVSELAGAGRRPLSVVRTLSPGQAELARALGGGAAVAPGGDLWRAFERHALDTPDSPALTDRAAGIRLTYRQLHHLAVEQSRRLSGQGVRPGDRVVVDLPRSAGEAVAVLAVLRTGAAYVAVQAAAVPQGRDRVVAAVDARVRIGAGDGAGWPGTRVCPPVDLQPVPEAPPSAPPAAPVDPDRAAYVSFTSGSTGFPKGVVVPHRAVLRLARDADLFSPAEPAGRMRMLRMSPLAFDASTLELLVPLALGAAIEVSPPHDPSPGELAGLLAEAGVTHAWLTSGLFHLVADHGPEGLRPLRQLLTGGGVVSAAHVRRVLRSCPGLRVTNGYGPTENTTFTTVHHVDGPDQVDRDVPIGRPVAGTRLWVRDDRGAALPPGAVGELHAAGVGLADGYLADPERTAAAFGDRAAVGERTYRTGDLVRWDGDGQLRFLGRTDRQVKIAGHRVLLGEIEELIRARGGVLDAVVFLDEADGRQRLTAAVKTTTPAPDLASLREQVQAGLAAPARPQRWLAVRDFPLTRNGKVDLDALAALPEPDTTAEDPGPGPVAAEPGDPGLQARLEELVTEVWTAVLGTDDFDPDEAFFDVGGDSLQIALVRNGLRDRLGGVALPLTDLYRFPTVRALAGHLRETGRPRPA